MIPDNILFSIIKDPLNNKLPDFIIILKYSVERWLAYGARKYRGWDAGFGQTLGLAYIGVGLVVPLAPDANIRLPYNKTCLKTILQAVTNIIMDQTQRQCKYMV